MEEQEQSEEPEEAEREGPSQDFFGRFVGASFVSVGVELFVREAEPGVD